MGDLHLAWGLREGIGTLDPGMGNQASPLPFLPPDFVSEGGPWGVGFSPFPSTHTSPASSALFASWVEPLSCSLPSRRSLPLSVSLVCRCQASWGPRLPGEGTPAPAQTGNGSVLGGSHAAAPSAQAFQVGPPPRSPWFQAPPGLRPPRGPVPLGQPSDIPPDPLRETGHALDTPKCTQPPSFQVRERSEPLGPGPTDFLRWRLVVGSPPLAVAWHRKALADRRRGGSRRVGSSPIELEVGAGWGRGVSLHHSCSESALLWSSSRDPSMLGPVAEYFLSLRTRYTAHSQVAGPEEAAFYLLPRSQAWGGAGEKGCICSYPPSSHGI